MTAPVDRATLLDIFVPGDPAPQGSKRYLGKYGVKEDSKRTPAWRADIRDTVLRHIDGQDAYPGPVIVMLEFVMPRPAGTPKTKPTPPAVKKADVDKLSRAVLDALTSAGVYLDDKQVCGLIAVKRLAEIAETPGCIIVVRATQGRLQPEIDVRVVAE